jgi:ribosomal protein L18E
MRLRQNKNSFLMTNHKTQIKFYKMIKNYRRNKRDQNMNIKTSVSTNLYKSKEDKKFFRFSSLIKNFKFLSFLV